MATEVTNYQCPACTAPLRYDGPLGKLVCDYCESHFSVQEIEEHYKETVAQAEEVTREAAEKAPEQEFDDWGAEDGMRAYSCPSCGAQLICDATTAASSCPYCGNPTVVPGQFSGVRRPNHVLPFKLSKEDAITVLKNHYKGKFLLPKAFAQASQLEKIQGVYVPFWLYDTKAQVRVAFAATQSHTHHTRNERVTTTRHYEVIRGGTVNFSRIPADGSTKMADAYMDSLEPFHYEDLKPFSLAYLPGYLADKYDMDAEACTQRIYDRCRSSAVELMRRDAAGYDTCTPRDVQFQFEVTKADYTLMPVWMLTTRWNGKAYLFAINGQTGKVAGELPVDWGRFALLFMAIFGGLAAILLLLLFLGFIL